MNLVTLSVFFMIQCHCNGSNGSLKRVLQPLSNKGKSHTINSKSLDRMQTTWILINLVMVRNGCIPDAGQLKVEKVGIQKS